MVAQVPWVGGEATLASPARCDAGSRGCSLLSEGGMALPTAVQHLPANSLVRAPLGMCPPWQHLSALTQAGRS